jgi:hypothetical protein
MTARPPNHPANSINPPATKAAMTAGRNASAV